MKSTIKVMAFIITLVTVLTAIPVSVAAAKVENEIMPLWDNMSSNTISLAFVDGRGIAEATTVGRVGTTRIQIDVYVYRQVGSDWTYVTEDHEDVNRRSWGITCEFIPIANAYYRADFTFTITKNGVDEVVYDSYYNTYIPE